MNLYTKLLLLSLITMSAQGMDLQTSKKRDAEVLSGLKKVVAIRRARDRIRMYTNILEEGIGFMTEEKERELEEKLRKAEQDFDEARGVTPKVACEEMIEDQSGA